MELIQILSKEQMHALSEKSFKQLLDTNYKLTVAEYAKMSNEQINTFPHKEKIKAQVEFYLYNLDLKELKRCVAGDYSDYRKDGIDDPNYMIGQIAKILLKHKSKKFYLTYEMFNKIEYFIPRGSWDKEAVIKCRTKNWELYDEDEFKQMLPTGVDIKDICYNKGKKPFDIVDYPDDYSTGQVNKVSQKLEQFGIIYDNIFYVHPVMFNCAKRFFK
jgi:hypothetical protein